MLLYLSLLQGFAATASSDSGYTTGEVGWHRSPRKLEGLTKCTRLDAGQPARNFVSHGVTGSYPCCSLLVFIELRALQLTIRWIPAWWRVMHDEILELSGHSCPSGQGAWLEIRYETVRRFKSYRVRKHFEIFLNPSLCFDRRYVIYCYLWDSLCEKHFVIAESASLPRVHSICFSFPNWGVASTKASKGSDQDSSCTRH